MRFIMPVDGITSRKRIENSEVQTQHSRRDLAITESSTDALVSKLWILSHRRERKNHPLRFGRLSYIGNPGSEITKEDPNSDELQKKENIR